MIKLMIFGLSLLIGICTSSTVLAGDCHSDTVVKRWLEERDGAAKQVVQVWIKGAQPDDYASDVAVTLSNELYICSKCRGQEDFLTQNLIILGKESNPNVKTVPGMILEYLVGQELLSPYNQFPSDRGRRVVLK